MAYLFRAYRMALGTAAVLCLLVLGAHALAIPSFFNQTLFYSAVEMRATTAATDYCIFRPWTWQEIVQLVDRPTDDCAIPPSVMFWVSSNLVFDNFCVLVLGTASILYAIGESIHATAIAGTHTRRRPGTWASWVALLFCNRTTQ